MRWFGPKFEIKMATILLTAAIPSRRYENLFLGQFSQILCTFLFKKLNIVLK